MKELVGYNIIIFRCQNQITSLPTTLKWALFQCQQYKPQGTQ